MCEVDVLCVVVFVLLCFLLCVVFDDEVMLIVDVGLSLCLFGGLLLLCC